MGDDPAEWTMILRNGRLLAEWATRGMGDGMETILFFKKTRQYLLEPHSANTAYGITPHLPCNIPCLVSLPSNLPNTLGPGLGLTQAWSPGVLTPAPPFRLRQGTVDFGLDLGREGERQ